MLIGYAFSLAHADAGAASDPDMLPIFARLSGLTDGEARDGTTIGVTLTNAPSGAAASYRWQQDGVDIPGATDETTRVEIGSTHADNGRLRCVVTIDGVEHVTGSAPMRHAPGALSIITPPTWIVDDTLVSLAATGTGANLIFSKFRLSGLPHLSIDPSNGLITGRITMPEHELQPSGTGTATAEDQYGRTYTVTFSWTSDLRAQATAANPIADRSWTVDDDMIDLDVTTAFAANGNTLSYTITGLPTGVIDDGDGSISGTPSVDGQIGTVSIRAVDEYARETLSTFSGTTAYRTRASAAGALGPFTWTVDDSVVSEDAASDFTANGNRLTYAASNLPAGIAIDPATGEMAGTPTAAGSGSVTITATDEYDRQTLSVTSHTTALRPQATAPGTLAPLSFTLGDPMDLDLGAGFTANGNSLGYTISGLPSGLADDGDGSISGTPTVNGQSGTITIAATDEYGRVTAAAVSYVTSSDAPTQATAANGLGPFAWTVDDTSVAVNASTDFTLNGNSLTYTATGLPAGLSIASNGLVTGTPRAASSGSISITGTDTLGRKTTSTTTHTTSLRTAATTANNLADQSFTVGVSVDLDLTGDFTANGNDLTYSIAGLPAGLSDDGDGTISGTPTAAGTGSITITGTDEYGRASTSAFGYTTRADTFAVTDEGDGTISVAWTGTLTSITVGGGGPFDGTYTAFHDGTALDDTHLLDVAGRALAITPTRGTAAVSETLEAGAILILSDDSQPVPLWTIQWQRDGIDIAGATGATYLLQVADEGADIRPTFVVTASGQPSVTEAGSAVSLASSDTTAPSASTISAGEQDPGGDVAVTVSNLDEDSTMFWVLIPAGDTVPSDVQVVAGQNAAGSATAQSGMQAVTTTGGPYSFALPSGLNATHDLHVVFQDAAGNNSTVYSATNIAIDTRDTAPWSLTGGIEELTITSMPTVTAPTVTGGVAETTITE